MINNLAAGLVVIVKDKATRVLGTIGKGFQKLKVKGRELKAGLSKIGQGLRGLSIAGLAVTGIFAGMAFKAANFEEQMSAVRAIMSDTTDAEFVKLESEIKRLGATTAFSATEAAEGSELLARAGFTATEQIDALGATLAAAAAEGIEMSTAANIISNNVRAFGLEAKDAGMVADVLAVTSAKTNTSMTQLGEGMKLVASTAKKAGIPIADTSMALGLLANAGLQGSVGGTALNTMLLKLGSLSDSSKDKFKALGIEIADASGNMLSLPELLENIGGGLTNFQGNVDELGFLTETFGIRGQKAAGILTDAFAKMNVVGEDGVNQFEALKLAIEDSGGAAEKMATERLNNLKGAFTLLGSAIEAVSIEFMSPILEEMTQSTKVLADSISFLADGMMKMDDVLAGRYVPNMEGGKAITADTAISIAELGAGFALAARDIAGMMRQINAFKDSMMEAFGGQGGEGSLIGVGRMAGLLFTATAALAAFGAMVGIVVVPVLGAFWLVGEGIVAVIGVIGAVLAPVLFQFALFAAFIQATRKEGQSFGGRMKEVFSGLTANASAFFSGFMESYSTMMKPSIDALSVQFGELWEAIKPAFVAIGEAFGMSADEAGGFGATMGTIIGFLTSLLLLPVFIITDLLAPTLGFMIENVIVPFIGAIGMIGEAFVGLLSGTKTFSQAFGLLIKGLAGVIFNSLLLPFKTVLIAILEGAAALGAVSQGTLESVKGVLNQEAGTVFGKPAKGAQSAAAKATVDAHAAAKGAMESGFKDPQTSVAGQIETKVEGCIKNDITIGAKPLSVATSEHQFELSQRGGFSLNPFQQGPIIANGGIPAGSTG